LTSDPEFRAEHLSRVQDLPRLQRDLEEAVRSTARDSAAETLELIVQSALNLLRFRRDELRPEPLFELAMRGEPDPAAARLVLFDVEPEWHQIATAVVAWLAADSSPQNAKALRDRVAGMQPLSPRAARIISFFDAWTGLKPPPSRGPLPAPLPVDVIRAIVERLGGSGAASAELLASYNIPELRDQDKLLSGRTAGRANQGYLSETDGPYLVSFAQEAGEPGNEFLRQYVEIHTGYQYVQYRNRSLGFLLDAVCNHQDPRWVRAQAVQIATSALAGSRSDFQEALPTAVLAVRAKSDSAAAAQIQSMLQDAISGTESLSSGRRSDPLSRSKRSLAATIEAFYSLARAAECQTLIGRAPMILRTGFAGYSAPACLTIAESIEIAQNPSPDVLRQVLDNALSAAHNAQDPLYCARVTARVHAMRNRWWDATFNLEPTVEHFWKESDAPEFASTFLVGERFEHRSPNSMPMEPEFLPETVEEATGEKIVKKIEEAFKLRPGELTPLNEDVARDGPLRKSYPIRLPDPGFATWLAARFAGRALADRTLSSSRRIALIRALVPLAVASPTALDTVLARLVLAEQPASTVTLDRIANLAAAAIAPPGSMAAALPDAALPA